MDVVRRTLSEGGRRGRGQVGGYRRRERRAVGTSDGSGVVTACVVRGEGVEGARLAIVVFAVRGCCCCCFGFGRGGSRGKKIISSTIAIAGKVIVGNANEQLKVHDPHAYEESGESEGGG